MNSVNFVAINDAIYYSFEYSTCLISLLTKHEFTVTRHRVKLCEWLHSMRNPGHIQARVQFKVKAHRSRQRYELDISSFFFRCRGKIFRKRFFYFLCCIFSKYGVVNCEFQIIIVPKKLM